MFRRIILENKTTTKRMLVIRSVGDNIFTFNSPVYIISRLWHIFAFIKHLMCVFREIALFLPNCIVYLTSTLNCLFHHIHRILCRFHSRENKKNYESFLRSSVEFCECNDNTTGMWLMLLIAKFVFGLNVFKFPSERIRNVTLTLREHCFCILHKSGVSAM